MSSEFSCSYCSNMPRNPCYSKSEAATCPNADRGRHHEFNVRHIVDWLRYNAYSDDDTDVEIRKAADILEKHEYRLL